MPSLRHRVAQLARESEGRFRDQLEAALHTADSKLPEDLTDNGSGEPTDTKQLVDKIKGKTATLNRRQLDALVLEQATSLGLPRPQDAKATPPVVAAAGKFLRGVSKALAVYVQRFPPMGQATAGDLMAANGAYRVYRTLDGAKSGGIYAGDWNVFYDDLKSIERFMFRAVARDFQQLKDTIVDAALQTAGGE